MHRVLRCMVLALALLIPAPRAQANETLIFGLPQEPPWTFENTDGSLSGLSYEVGEALSRSSGLSFTYERYPFIRSRVALEDGSIDLAMLFPTEATRQKVLIVAPLAVLSIILLPNVNGSYRTLSDFEGKTVAVQRGTEYDERLTGNAAIGKDLVTSFASGLRMAHAGRVAGVAGSDVALYYTMKTLGLKRQNFGPPLILTQRAIPLLLGMKRATPDLVARLKAAADSLRNAGIFDDIVAKYTDPDQAMRQP